MPPSHNATKSVIKPSFTFSN